MVSKNKNTGVFLIDVTSYFTQATVQIYNIGLEQIFKFVSLKVTLNFRVHLIWSNKFSAVL